MRIFIAILASLFLWSTAHSESAFFGGTYAGDYRYNVHKCFDVADSQLCWAAAASNCIQLWQDRISELKALPDTIPNGRTQTNYSCDIFATFVDEWTNNPYYEENAFSWWINGTIVNLSSNPNAARLKNNSSGGYWDFLNFEDYKISTYIKATKSKNWFLDEILGAQEDDSLMTCGIYSSTISHSITIWGCEYDSAAYLLEGIWISDSDTPEYDSNFYVPLTWNGANSCWEFNSELNKYAGVYVGDITVFNSRELLSAFIPEPLYSAILTALFVSVFIFGTSRPNMRA